MNENKSQGPAKTAKQTNKQKIKIKDPEMNLFSPISDQERISPYNINIISGRQVMRIKKISIRGSLVNPIPNSLN